MEDNELAIDQGSLIIGHYKQTETALAVGSINVEPYTLYIETELLRLKHKEMDLEINIDPKKFENIDTIIINGYKYVKNKIC